MMLFKLSLKNIKKSIKDYAIYFFTLILGVSIFYVFNAIDSQTVLLNVTSDTRDIIKLMTNMLSGVSVLVSIILGFLIIYASRFLIKRRNKEFGIYLTLGMSKKSISKLLFFETLFIGLISLVVGLGVGIILSQFMSVLVANMFEADLTQFAFTFSGSAVIKTLIYFGIMYILVMIFNTINVNRCKLIDLLYASRKSEEVKLKNPILCTIIFIGAALLLARAYYLVTAGFNTMNDASDIFKPIIMGSVATFLIFWSLSGLILRIVMSIKKVYYKGLNSFVVRQISSKINTTVISTSIICLMLFVTICVFSSAISIKNSMTENLKTLAPMDIEFEKRLNLTEETVEKAWNLNREMIPDSYLSMEETLNKLGYNMSDNLKDIISFNTYSTKEVQFKDTLGSYFDELVQNYPYMANNADLLETFVKASDYNKLLRTLGKEEINIQDNEYVLVADYQEFVDMRNVALKQNTPISLNGKTYYPKYEKNITGFIYMSSTNSNTGFFVVPDEALTSDLARTSIVIANYKGEDKQAYEDKVIAIQDNSYIKSTSLNLTSKMSLYTASVGLGAMVTFIGLYIGIIFLISSAAILALKELSESTDNKERFKMLRKLGADEATINNALFKEILVFFMAPLVFAIIHSIFGIKFCNTILSIFGQDSLLPSIIMTAVFLTVIYGGYFLLTYMCSKNIIKEQRL